MKKILHIKGMNCKSCEIYITQIIEKEVIGSKVESISHKQGTIKIEYKNENDLEKIIQIINKKGYIVGTKTKPHKKKLINTLIVLISLIGLLIFVNLNIYKLLPNYDKINRMIAFLIGLIASVSSCLALTGGVIIGYSQNINQNEIKKTQIKFHIGRLLAFIIGGALLGLIGNGINFSIGINVVLNILVGIILLYLGLQTFQILPNISKLGIILPTGISKIFLNINNQKYASLVGASTFFIPCGFTQSLQLFALQSGSIIDGAILMGSFALGTLPVLIGIGFGSNYIKNKIKSFKLIIATILIFFGSTVIYNGIIMIMNINQNNINNGNNIETEIETINVSHDGREFIPNTIKLKHGKKYIISVTPNSDGKGCMFALSYGGKDYYIKKDQKFELFVDGTKKGNIPLVCSSMGMKQGMIIIE